METFVTKHGDVNTSPDWYMFIYSIIIYIKMSSNRFEFLACPNSEFDARSNNENRKLKRKPLSCFKFNSLNNFYLEVIHCLKSHSKKNLRCILKWMNKREREWEWAMGMVFRIYINVFCSIHGLIFKKEAFPIELVGFLECMGSMCTCYSIHPLIVRCIRMC